jgi:hypothetical protein
MELFADAALDYPWFETHDDGSSAPVPGNEMNCPPNNMMDLWSWDKPYVEEIIAGPSTAKCTYTLGTE